jgi:hypothetical protein
MGRELETLTQKELKQILDYDSKTGIFKVEINA